MENSTEQAQHDNFSPLSVQDVDVDILPIVYEIMRSVERDFHDNSAKVRESQDCSLKVLELQKKLDSARAQDAELEENSSQTQKELAFSLEVTQQAVSDCLKSLGIINKPLGYESKMDDPPDDTDQPTTNVLPSFLDPPSPPSFVTVSDATFMSASEDEINNPFQPS
ncbi:Mediator of RNA polymerase II transcription subunit 9 [Eumeta japonica]|uniref:Mediator of RNA polymerase II transcription subunit 9 n=1 Tax=Eumeta variegata TaxID=151549 RepID=A0A4C1XU62_EUMVA|nr:Mediator of RNA polymerase II transcription subunit 9 [Eumeta japonica]